MLLIFNKNVVFQYKLMVVLTGNFIGKMREKFARKACKILRKASASSINRSTNNSRSSIARLAIILIISIYILRLQYITYNILRFVHIC